MKTIMVYTPKGGASKSTLVREIAVCLTIRGERVAIQDLDEQGTTTSWYQRRLADQPTVISPEADIKSIQKELDYLLIDTPPGVIAQEVLAERKADLIVVPVRPSPDDLTSALAVVSLLKRKNWTFVLTQTPPRAKLNDEAARALAGHGKVAPTNMGFRVDYPTASVSGLAAIEYRSSKAAAEINSLTDYILKCASA